MDAFQGVDGDLRVARAAPVARRRAAAGDARHLPERVPARDGRRAGECRRSGSPSSRTRRPTCRCCRTRDEARAALDIDGPTLAFAGRIGRQKSLEVGIEAVSRVAGVRLLVAGDGPERRRWSGWRRDRVRFLGPLPREDVLRLFRAADASLLSSTWENFPHTVVESLAVGTPVIATAVGGVPEVVTDGENGLLVPPGDAERARGRHRAASTASAAFASGSQPPPRPRSPGTGRRRCSRASRQCSWRRRGEESSLHGRPDALPAAAVGQPRAEVLGARAALSTSASSRRPPTARAATTRSASGAGCPCSTAPRSTRRCRFASRASCGASSRTR